MAKSVNSTKPQGDLIGRLYHRAVSIVPLFFGLVTSYFSWSAISNGETVGGMFLAIISVLLFWTVKWCWSSVRSAGDIDP